MGSEVAIKIGKDILAPIGSFGAAAYGAFSACRARRTFQSNRERGVQVVSESDKQFPGTQETVGPTTVKAAKAAQLNVMGSSTNIGAAISNAVAAASELGLNSYELIKGVVTNSTLIHIVLTRTVNGVGVVVNTMNAFVQGKSFVKARKEKHQAITAPQKKYCKACARNQGILAVTSALQAIAAGVSFITGNPVPVLVITVVGVVVPGISNHFTNKELDALDKDNSTDIELRKSQLRLDPGNQNMRENVARIVALSASPPTLPDCPLPSSPSQSQDDAFTSLNSSAQTRLVSFPLDPINEDGNKIINAFIDNPVVSKTMEGMMEVD